MHKQIKYMLAHKHRCINYKHAVAEVRHISGSKYEDDDVNEVEWSPVVVAILSHLALIVSEVWHGEEHQDADEYHKPYYVLLVFAEVGGELFHLRIVALENPLDI
jgi:hypothetical protein